MRNEHFNRLFFIASMVVVAVFVSLMSRERSVAQPTILGPANAIICNLAPQVAVGVTGVTQIVAAVAGQRVFTCGWHVTNTASAGTFQISMGTGSNCGTNNVVLTPVLNVSNTAPSTDHIDFVIFQTGQGQALCFNPSVATIAALVYAAQF